MVREKRTGLGSPRLKELEEYSGGGESVMISSHVLSCCCCCLREEFNLWLSKLFNRSVCV